MRITAGYARGIFLNSPKGDATRPATDAARLAIFSSLGDIIENAQILDIFAGTGSYGLEAASRGAKSVVFIENNAQAFKVLKSNIAEVKKLVSANFSAIMCDCLKSAKRLENTNFDIVFADPPYALLSNADFQEKLFSFFKEIACQDTIFVLEAPAEYNLPQTEQIEELKRLGKKSKGKPSQIIFKITPNIQK